MLCSDGLSSANYADLQNNRSYESRTHIRDARRCI
jgi:hypothetical protein